MSFSNLHDLEQYLEHVDDYERRQRCINILAERERLLEDLGNHDMYQEWLLHEQQFRPLGSSRRRTIDCTAQDISNTTQDTLADNLQYISPPVAFSALDPATGEWIELPRVSRLVQDATAEFDAHRRAVRQITPLIRVDTTLPTPEAYMLPKTTQALVGASAFALDGQRDTPVSPSDYNATSLSVGSHASPQDNTFATPSDSIGSHASPHDNTFVTPSDTDGSSDDQYGLEIEVVIKKVRMQGNNSSQQRGFFRVKYIEFESEEAPASEPHASASHDTQARVLNFEPLMRDFEYNQDPEHDNKGFFLATSGKMIFLDRTFGEIEYLEPTLLGTVQEPLSAEARLEEQNIPVGGFGSGPQEAEGETGSGRRFTEDGRE